MISSADCKLFRKPFYSQSPQPICNLITLIMLIIGYFFKRLYSINTCVRSIKLLCGLLSVTRIWRRRITGKTAQLTNDIVNNSFCWIEPNNTREAQPKTFSEPSSRPQNVLTPIVKNLNSSSQEKDIKQTTHRDSLILDYLTLRCLVLTVAVSQSPKKGPWPMKVTAPRRLNLILVFHNSFALQRIQNSQQFQQDLRQTRTGGVFRYSSSTHRVEILELNIRQSVKLGVWVVTFDLKSVSLMVNMSI